MKSGSCEITAKSFCCLLLLLIVSKSFALQSDPVESLIHSLLSAKSEEERELLLKEHSALLTVQLCKSFLARGDTLRGQNDLAGALTAFELARKVAEKIQDRGQITEALINIALINRTQGDMQLALKNIQTGLDIAQETGDPFLIGRSLIYRGIFFRYQGDSDQAISYTKKALALADHLPEKELALAWNNLGTIQWLKGNFNEALKHFEKALEIRLKLGDKSAIAMSFNNIAMVYDGQGSFGTALKYYNQSLRVFEELGDKVSMANVLNNMTDLRLIGNVDAYLENCKKNLALAEETGDKPIIARALGNMANAYAAKGDYHRALEFSFRALRLGKELEDKLFITVELHRISEAYFGQGHYEKSLEYAQLSEKTAREITGRQPLWRALESQGRCYRKLNQPALAYNAYSEAIGTIEDWRSLVAGGELEEQSLFSEKLQAYYGMIELLLEQNKVTEAFSCAERARGRALLDVLHSGRIDVARDMTSQERAEEARWNKKLISLNRSIQDQKSNPDPDRKRIAELESELETVRLDFEAFRSKLYSLHPDLKVHRGETEPIRFDQISQLFPDDSIAVFEYVVTESNTFLFVLTKTGDHRDIRVHRIGIPENELQVKVQDFRKQIANREASFGKAARTLYSLLIEPGIGDLFGQKKLVLVPDAVLWELPFQVLQSEKYRFLQEDFSLCYVPSLTVLREIKRLHKEKQHPGAPTLLAFGNPSLRTLNQDYANILYRDADLRPLPEAEREVKILKKIYGSQQSTIYIASQAREEYFKSQAGQFDILHFATHGVLNNGSPMYSYLAFASGDSELEDGLLEAREIMNLNLKADIAVLSACETALGKIGKGEGMIGLSWSFFVAGVPAILAGQWKVHSESTAELMLLFHQNLKSGIPKAEAIRRAAVQLSQKTKYHHPFYWAPFILIGYGF